MFLSRAQHGVSLVLLTFRKKYDDFMYFRRFWVTWHLVLFYGISFSILCRFLFNGVNNFFLIAWNFVADNRTPHTRKRDQFGSDASGGGVLRVCFVGI